VLRRTLVGFLFSAAAASGNVEVGSRVCAGCHAEIYRKYMATGMAQSAGATGQGRFRESWQRASFRHEPSGIEYRLSAGGKGYRMEFARPDSEVQGERRLEWFVGSGGLGRSYLFSSGGFLYQAPVSYYSAPSAWQVSPGYENKRGIDLTRAVETACLQCHASRLQPVVGTQNGFTSPPFLEGGVSCERCHGPGEEHAARKGEIVNPGKLAPYARDSVCAQCHLTGAARVARQTRPYRPGELLSSSLAVFVWDGGGAQLTATSHYERLDRSACKQASGDKLWCGTCHDPHQALAAADRAGYYRKRCLACHEKQGCAASMAARRVKGDDCTACHMPKGNTRTVEHVAFTDHGIVREARGGGGVAERRLLSFWKEVSERDYALGYAVLAMTEPGVRREALARLEAAAEQDPNDIPVLAQLAQFYDRLGREEQAMALCERIIKLDPIHIAASVNLGIYRAKRGMTEEAIRLWGGALERNPALTGSRVNLAVAQYRSGNLAAAEASLAKALEYDPDAETARRLLSEVRAARR
jgi:hypothetical protein